MFLLYMLGVLFALIIWSAACAVTRKGASQEIWARGAANVGLVTHKIADGTASLGDKVGVVIATALGAFISPMWLVASALVGGILFLIFHIWLGFTR
jgi:hypothetical protein